MNNVNANPGPSSGDKPENEKIWKKVRDVQNQILMLTNRVGKIEPTMGKVVEAVNVVKETLQSSLDEDNLASIMKDVIQQVRLEEVENDNVRRKGQVMEVTEVRSNSGHFDGVIKSKLKRYKNLSGGKQVMYMKSTFFSYLIICKGSNIAEILMFMKPAYVTILNIQ